ncbi:MAG: hypothetical protein HUU15_03230 [Candidatus Brocadiae bacterium]|nr:hypothetical protein [Candidatus Brocadiia bacterium]
MRARRSVWADPEIQKLAGKFIPATDEVTMLHRDQGAAGKHFRLVSEKGHYGRNPLDWTRQGLYCLAPSGEFLGSVNSTRAEDVKAFLKESWEAWEKLPKGRRLMEGAPGEWRDRWADRYPVDGMVWKVTSRDLPRANARKDWAGHAWNIDYAWFRREDLARFMPADAKAGLKKDVDGELVARFARCHLVDNVRGQTIAFPADAVKKATMVLVTESVKGDRVTVRLEGEVRLEQRGRWAVDDTGEREQTRGFEGKLLGAGVWSLKAGTFESLEIVAAGVRWGATRYNFRADDLERGAIGYVMQLAPDTPADRMAPASIWEYGW